MRRTFVWMVTALILATTVPTWAQDNKPDPGPTNPTPPSPTNGGQINNPSSMQSNGPSLPEPGGRTKSPGQIVGIPGIPPTTSTMMGPAVSHSAGWHIVITGPISTKPISKDGFIDLGQPFKAWLSFEWESSESNETCRVVRNVNNIPEKEVGALLRYFHLDRGKPDLYSVYKLIGYVVDKPVPGAPTVDKKLFPELYTVLQPDKAKK